MLPNRTARGPACNDLFVSLSIWFLPRWAHKNDLENPQLVIRLPNRESSCRRNQFVTPEECKSREEPWIVIVIRPVRWVTAPASNTICRRHCPPLTEMCLEKTTPNKPKTTP